MYSLKTFVKFHYTDAAGILFFSNIFLIAHDAYENMLNSIGLGIGTILKERDFLLPLVHVEADYKQPLRAGDPITVRAWVRRLGRTSYTLSYEVLNEKNEVAANVETVHVAVDKATNQKIEIPADLRIGLEKFAG